MTLELSFYGLSSLVLGAIGIFSAIVLATHKRTDRPLWICNFLLGLSMSMLLGYFEEAGWLQQPFAFFPSTILSFMTGPSLYLYARLPWRQNLSSRDWLHGLPILVGIVVSAMWYQALRFDGDPGLAVRLWSGLLYVNSFSYSVATLYSLKRYRFALKEHFSDVYRRRLPWLHFAAWGVLALVGTDLILGILLGAGGPNVEAVRLTLTLLFSLMIFLLSLSALRDPARFLPELSGSLVRKPSPYANSGISERTLADWRQRLERVMQESRPYLVNDLTLRDLAGEVEIRPHHLSQLLNQSLGCTFYDYINEARIGHACKLLTSTSDAVVDIAFASGFNNKTSFYKAFRKQAGLTPNAFRLAQQSEVQMSSAV